MALGQDEAQARSELLLRDAEDELKREKMQLWWKQWGPTIIGMCLMLVIGTAAGVGYREWRRAQNEQSTAQLLKIVGDDKAILTPDVAKDMGGNHAAIAYLTKAGTLKEDDKTALQKLYGAAANAGDDTVWGWLGRWNTLRLRMDDPKEDPAKLLKDYEKLAADVKKSSLSALAYTDAAVIAGERMKDPKNALSYVQKAEAIVPRGSPMATIIADLKHLYEIRVQQAPAPDVAPAATTENAK